MVVVIVLIATFGKTARRFASPPPLADARVEGLEAHLQANDARGAQAEERPAELGEKQNLMEKLLARPAVPSRIQGSRPREG